MTAETEEPVDQHHPVSSPQPDTSGFLGATVGLPRFGWTRVAMALRPMWDADEDLLRVEVAGHEPLVIDVSMNAYWWPTPLEQMPADPEDLRIGREPKGVESPATNAPGNDLDGLLWRIGLGSFPGELAWWLQRDDRYRLVRWPNLTMLPHTPDQVRMTSLLGMATMSVDELAERANVEPAEARRLVNAFSLMRILRSESPEVSFAPPTFDRTVHAARVAQESAATTPVSTPAPRTGLFRRLRDRLGL